MGMQDLMNGKSILELQDLRPDAGLPKDDKLNRLTPGLPKGDSLGSPKAKCKCFFWPRRLKKDKSDELLPLERGIGDCQGEAMASRQQHTTTVLPLCRHGYHCSDFKNGDTQHCAEYHHERMDCRYGKDCRNKDPTHLHEFKHPDGLLPPTTMVLPLCRHGYGCSDFKNGDTQHCAAYRHEPRDCRYGKNCRNKDPTHLHEFKHP